MCGGYDSAKILDRVRESTIRVRDGQAVYERDSVLFDRVEYSWPCLSALLYIALANDHRLNLIDFGGSLGTTYYQNRRFLSAVRDLQWSIVEQKAFVTCGKELFENEHLRFHDDFDRCRVESGADTLLVSSSIQYLENPFGMVDRFVHAGFRYMIFDRTGFAETPDHGITIQRVPPNIYEASYPCWIFNYGKFLGLFTERFEVVSEFRAFVGDSYTVNGLAAGDRGFFLERKE